MRMTKLLRKAKGLQIIVFAIIAGMKSIVFIFLLLFIVFVMYATAGTIYMGMNDPVRSRTPCTRVLSLTPHIAVAFWKRAYFVRDALYAADDE